jgi:Protein of unknown function (DUF1570)
MFNEAGAKTMSAMMAKQRGAGLVCACVLFLVLCRSVHADILSYTIPGTEATIELSGRVTVNPGGTVSFRHPRGTLHFNIRDCRIQESKTTKELYSAERSKAIKSDSVDGYLTLARWCIDKGMIEAADQSLSDAWKLAPDHPEVKLMVQLAKHRKSTVIGSGQIEKEMHDFLKQPMMKSVRSRHYILMHDCSDDVDPLYGMSVAEHRLELLEKVYDSFFMKYALLGHPLPVPKEPMRVVLFSDHANYLNFVRILDPALKMAAGFYSPKENIAIFYLQKSDESRDGLNELVSALVDMRETARRERTEGAGELIRMVKSLELLVDIEGENQEIEVVTHEATHQLAANSGLMDREKFHVRWAHEGLASYFEAPKDATWSGIGAVNETRLEYYRILALHPEYSKLQFVVTDRIFDYAGNQFTAVAAYGQAWALTHFLMNNRTDQLVQFYREMATDTEDTERDDQWRNKLLATFVECFGDMDALELEWQRYMRNLRTDRESLMQK